jgi:hypothetical protein
LEVKLEGGMMERRGGEREKGMKGGRQRTRERERESARASTATTDEPGADREHARLQRVLDR